MHARSASEHPQSWPFFAPSTCETEARPSSPSGVIRPVTAAVPSVSTLHFLVHASMPEVQQLASSRGWLLRGFTMLSIPWIEMHWTVDGWETVHVLRSTDVPCPVVDGRFFLPDIPSGTEVAFAVRAGVWCHAPSDRASCRDMADVWFNNDGRNYTQVTT